MSGFLLGIDAGSSSIKTSVINSDNGKLVAGTSFPKNEMEIISVKPGWAEQDPESWWLNLKKSIAALRAKARKPFRDISAIGISYQMHGLVVVDKKQKVLRPSIIWCDSRAVKTGEKAMRELGEKFCLDNFLNSPGNFTASKLGWVKENEPSLYRKIFKMMLPGDYLAMKLTGEIQTTIPGLSEAILWNFSSMGIAAELLNYYGIDMAVIPPIVQTFSEQGRLSGLAANELGLAKGIPVTYRAGDQPNNAFSLNVLNPGEVAATAGTSGVVYGISEKPSYDSLSRVNTFVHVNHTSRQPRYGVLLCINGTGILNSWLKQYTGGEEYDSMNRTALSSPVGARGLVVLPFGNGAERVLENRDLQASIAGLNFNIHRKNDLYRAGQEGIAYALKYGFDIMKTMGMEIQTVKAGKANMFLSPLFREAFVNTTGTTLKLYNTDGSQGAARGAGLGAGIFRDFQEAFTGLKSLAELKPDKNKLKKYHESYNHWLNHLNKLLI